MKIQTYPILTALMLAFFGNAQADLPDLAILDMQVKSLQADIEQSGDESKEEKCQVRKKIIEDNINSIQKCLMKKIKKLKGKLAEYKSALENAVDQDEAEYFLDRIESLEKKLKDLNDTLLGIELLKSRLLIQ
jgi:uncharacterized protein YpuA (DUF1002 family)